MMTDDEHGLTETQQGYLETIYHLQLTHRVARVKEIASTMSVRAPSVSRVLRELADKGMIDYEPYGTVCLTEAGTRIGQDLTLRRRAAEDFLVSVLGVKTDMARDVADRIEHHLPPEVLCRLVQFVNHYTSSGVPGYRWEPHCHGLCERRYGSGCIVQ